MNKSLNISLSIVLAFVVGAYLVSTAFSAPLQNKVASERAATVQNEWVEEVFIDYGPDADTHAGNGPHPTTESSRFHLTQGGISWFASSTPVEYEVTGSVPAAWNTAIAGAEATWDGFVPSRSFAQNNLTLQTNPCTLAANAVTASNMDGPGNVLASASVCRNVATKEIAGFVITVDLDDAWKTGATTTSAFDVENVVSHEFGHVMGLGHVNAPKDGCLAMYRFAGLGEIQKRTLGWGDKLGMDALYSTGNTSAGPGCGF